MCVGACGCVCFFENTVVYVARNHTLCGTTVYVNDVQIVVCGQSTHNHTVVHISCALCVVECGRLFVS